MSEFKETIRLYDQDGYAREFTATVLSCEECIQKKKAAVYQVVLDQTLFFPEEGGQSPDTGCLGGVKVLDVQIRKGVITHSLEKPLPVGEVVTGVIDWDHRFSNMQQHSGEHIFSGIVHTRFGYDNVGFHLSDREVTMDFSGPLTAEEIAQVEYEANRAIVCNVPVVVSYPSREELERLEYRSKKEIEGQVRIVTVTGYDVCACCAPHVRNTGEIGSLKVMSAQNYKGGVRISILCGFRALEAFREKAAVVSDLMNLLTTGQDHILASVTKLKNANQSMTSELAQAKQTLLAQKLADIPADQEDVFLFDQGLDTVIIRNTVNTLTAAHKGVCGIFNGNETDGYSFIIGSTSADCRMIAAALREKLSARGGGSAQMIQGSVTASRDMIQEAIRNVL